MHLLRVRLHKWMMFEIWTRIREISLHSSLFEGNLKLLKKCVDSTHSCSTAEFQFPTAMTQITVFWYVTPWSQAEGH
jgi:hypothetical protein